jgi:prevent-host-death family protein
MSEFSITEAKLRLSRLVRQVEAGQAVRILRRGKLVAVLISHREYEQRRLPANSLFDFTMALRQEAAQAGLPLFEATELDGLRDHSVRTDQTPWA